MNRILMLATLLFAITTQAAEPSASISITGKLAHEKPTAAEDVVISVQVSCNQGTHPFLLGSNAQVFGIYILGPWGPVQPDLRKIRPENWMHQEHSAARPIKITPDKPFETELRLADYFPVNDALAFREGRYQVNVKFYEITDVKMSRPVDTGAITFDLPAPRKNPKAQ